jgi:hypothetical protein
MVPRGTRLNIIIIIREATMARQGRHLIGNSHRPLKAMASINIQVIRTAVSKLLKLPALKIQVSLILRFSLLNRIYNPKMKVKRT